MHFALILIAALTVYAQAAPQFNSFNSRDWRSTGNLRQDQGQTDNGYHNQKNDVIHQGFNSQSTFTGNRRSNDYGQQVHQNYQGSSGQCWDPVENTYRDWPSHPQPAHHPGQFSNDNCPFQSNYNPYIYQNPHPVDHYHGPHSGRPEPPPRGWHGPQPPPDHYGHGPPHHHGHGPPDHHGHGPPHHHGHGPPPHHHHHEPPPQDHGYGYPPHYHQHGPRPLPPRPPHPPHNGNEYELEICEDTTKENNVSDKPETSTPINSDVVSIPTSLPVPSSSTKPEIVTESTSGKLVESTTQFDWNSYFPEGYHGPKDTDGIGLIDVRSGGPKTV